MDLSTTYLGLKLANPVIVGSSGLTNSVKGVKEAAEAGAGAVVLKSLFEEQILAQVDGLMPTEPSMWHPEAGDYIGRYGEEDAVSKYLDLISDAKKATSVPIIPSVHCVSAGKWTDFAARVEKAGADALELNVFVMPSDPRRDGPANEQVYFDVLKAVKSKVKLPVALKVGTFFSSISRTLEQLALKGADGLVLFNRFYSPDFDIEKLKLKPAPFVSAPGEIILPLRWIAILANRVECDLAATTGVHDATGVIKQLLAGANAVQVCSTLYRNGMGQVTTILEEVKSWMERKGFNSIDDFRGKMAASRSENPALYERVQFMKTSVGIE